MKNKFILNTFLLIIGGIITKMFGLIIKIIMTRSISTEALGNYMLILPTLMLVLTISQFGIPTAIAKLVAEGKHNNKKLVLSLIPLISIINIILMIIIFVIARGLSYNLVKNYSLYYGIISISLIIPFSTISAIIKSYFLGKNNVLPNILSNIVECIIKLLMYLYYLPKFKYKSISYIITFLMLSNVISVVISIFVLLIFLPKKISINTKDFMPNLLNIRESLSISIPNTTSKLIGSVGYFLEPLILTSTLKYVGYSSKYITYNYGIITGYIIPLILIPTFFSMAISEVLLPNISYDYSNNNIKSIKKKIKLSVLLSILIGFSYTFIILLFPNKILYLIYKTNNGIRYLKVLAPILFFNYITAPLSTTLEAIGKGFENMKISLISTIFRLIILFILSLFKIGLWGLIISTSTFVFTELLLSYKKILYYLS